MGTGSVTAAAARTDAGAEGMKEEDFAHRVFTVRPVTGP
jgi:hypothetical protein